ncbi:MAG: SIS domain-containing protein, partial [Alphaproteobacteria bacterium]
MTVIVDMIPACHDNDDILRATTVLETEAEGLLTLAKAIPPCFPDVVNLFLRTQGHVICTGIGKSGHIARKIAATLASTGTPSYFVHAAEANHGDLGMITPADAILVLSESGSNSELQGILDYANRLNIPLVGMTRDAHSALGRASDYVLLMPAAQHACPLGLAPTTMTTMMLGLGDALAVTLLQRRGFTPQDFKGFHPGGKLGKNLLSVADLMHTGTAIPTVNQGDTMPHVIMEMTQKRLGCTAVLDENKGLRGVITDGDLRRHLTPALLDQTAQSIMHPHVRTLRPQTLVTDALAFMNRHQLTSVFVVADDGVL